MDKHIIGLDHDIIHVLSFQSGKDVYFITNTHILTPSKTEEGVWHRIKIHPDPQWKRPGGEGF